MLNPPQIGTRCIVWCRPETSLILLFGEGTYEGNTFINGNYWPTIRLTNGREVTVHQQGVSVGVADQVAEQCRRFQGDVIEWDLDAYLRGERPTVEQRQHSPNNTNALPPPKTASDRVLYLKKEIELQEGKIKVAEKVITDARAIIAAKKKEISDQSQAVLTELATVNPDILKQLAAQVAAQLQGQPSAPQVQGEALPVTQPVAPPPIVRQVQPPPQDVDVDAIKVATED